MHAVLGAGSVGLALAAQLAAAGREVLVVARRPEAVAALRAGLRAEDPIAGGERIHRVAAALGAAEATTQIGDGPVFVCTREPDAFLAGRELARCAPGALAVAVQNGLEGGEQLARSLRRVVAAVWRQTATRVADAHVRFHGAARVVVGAEPGCDTGADAEALARELAKAGLDAACSPHIRDDQWLKLCVNLMSAPNALVRPGDHQSAAFVELKAQLLEEARAALAAAGIRAASCDGRDRDLDEEIRFQRASLARGTSARSAPLYNHVWTGLREGRALGAEDYHRRILELAARHGLPAPRNLRVLGALERAAREGLGPECVSAAELLEDGARLAGTPAAG
jgi:2-dehydropantoate 2-reductase